MKGKQEEERRGKPLVETDSYRIWPGESIPEDTVRKAKRSCLAVCPGERVYEVVVFPLGSFCTGKLLSKERISDGLISSMAKIEQADGTCRVLRRKGWITKEQHEEVVEGFRMLFGRQRIQVIRGEELEADVDRAVRLVEARGTRGRKAPQSTGPTAKKKEGGD